jgi:hypothetical protein
MASWLRPLLSTRGEVAKIERTVTCRDRNLRTENIKCARSASRHTQLIFDKTEQDNVYHWGPVLLRFILSKSGR